jgi:hypothetical protein
VTRVIEIRGDVFVNLGTGMGVDTGFSPLQEASRRTRAFGRRRSPSLTPHGRFKFVLAILRKGPAVRVLSRLAVISVLFGLLMHPWPANAETLLLRDDTWQIFTDGRVGSFLSWAYGDGLPQPIYRLVPNNVTIVQQITDGGWNWPSERQQLPDPALPGQVILSQGKVNQMRVGTGYAGLVLGFGLRNQISPTTRVVGYFQLWTFAETVDRVGDRVNSPDVRQGFVELQGPWGSLLAGRTRPLFSRAATEIELDYAHRWSLGFPPPGDAFPNPAEWFAAGMVYSTPPILGLRLSIGAFDPTVPGVIGLVRSKYASLEGELVFEHRFGPRSRALLFANGLVQKVYKAGYCPPPSPDSPSPCDVTMAGVGYGGRLELGRVHVGFAGHRSIGIQPDYLPEVLDAEVDPLGNLRNLDGYSVQGELLLGRFVVFGGASISRVFPTEVDNQRMQVPVDSTGQNEISLYSLIKDQEGVDMGVVFQPAAGLYLDLDYFRMQADWYLGEKQLVQVLNCGMVLGW